MISYANLVFSLISLSPVITCYSDHSGGKVCRHPGPGPYKAVVIINPDAGNVTGVLTFTQENEQSPVIIRGQLKKLVPAGNHGFHVHEFGNLTGGCMSAGDHFNPNNQTHGAPTDQVRHAGDFGNIISDANGVADVSVSDNHISLIGPCSVVGRALVVHAASDDLGKGGNPQSLKTGNAGGRLGCGVIGIA